ncbi:MAG: shikimate kinase [Candidatus Methanomethylophilus sp.]|nr:shikimate kinase [Methanomethylophilus sp.]
MSGIGQSHGCISVINGIVNGKGAVIGINLVTEAAYREWEEEPFVKVIGEETDDNLAKICVRRTLERIGKNPSAGYYLTIKSQIPPSRGLKSSSSVCNAVIRAVLDAYSVDMDDLEMIRLGVECAKEAKVTVTGSFDDACGCEFGGLIFTNNYENRIISRGGFGEYDVIICTPEYTKRKVPKEEYQAVSEEMEEIQRIAKDDPLKALTLNGRLIARVTGESTELIDKAMELGALAAGISGTGPAVAVVCGKGKGKTISEKLPCDTIVTETR